MTREGDAESFALGRAKASLQNLGLGVMEWRLRADVCEEPVARALMTVCKVGNSSSNSVVTGFYSEKSVHLSR